MHIVSVTEEWCGIAVAGPKSRELIARITDVDMSNDAFEFMGVREGRVADVPGRIYRISFSGELAYEIGVPADWGRHVWETLMEKGEDLGVQPDETVRLTSTDLVDGNRDLLDTVAERLAARPLHRRSRPRRS